MIIVWVTQVSKTVTQATTLMMVFIGQMLRYRPLRQGDEVSPQPTAILIPTIVLPLTTRLYVSEIEDFGKSECERAFRYKKSAKSTSVRRICEQTFCLSKTNIVSERNSSL